MASVNSFSKEERVAFEDILEGFNDSLILSKSVSIKQTDSTNMERSGDTFWRPMPYVAHSYNGTDMTGKFNAQTQLSVPASLSYSICSPWKMTPTELRDALQEKRLGDAAKQKIASDINKSVMFVASSQGTLVVSRSNSASGFDDVAECESIMNEQGINQNDRYLALSTRDYNGMASDLAKRQTLQGKPSTAYEKAYVGSVASFETIKLDYSVRLTSASATGVTINGANQYYTPKATTTSADGGQSNVDNRYQNITVSVTSGAIKVGDCFSILGVNALHHITKTDTGQLKTFRVIGIVTGNGGSGVITISPPIISGEGGTMSEICYQNVTATPANGAQITMMNTKSSYANPFWQKDAIELLPGRYQIPSNAGAEVLRGTTDNGVDVVMQKQYDINTMTIKYRLDTLFGVCNKQPEMTGVILFNQS